MLAIVLLTSVSTCLRNQHRRDRRVPAADIRSHHAAIASSLPNLHTEGYDALLILAESTINHLIHESVQATPHAQSR